MTNETKLDQLFKTVKTEFKNDLNPFLGTRIFSEIDNHKTFLEIILKGSFARFIQGGILATLIIFSFMNFQIPTKKFRGIVGNVYSINLDLNKVRKQNIVWIKINLPTGISLYSKNDNDTKSLKTLTIPLSSLKHLNEMPIVFKSIKEGGHEIKLTFLDSNKQLISSKKILLSFNHLKELIF